MILKLAKTNTMKKTVYIWSFAVLGLLVGLLSHAILELYYTKFLLVDFQKYNHGLSWEELWQYNAAVTIVLVFICTAWGYAAGKYWWHQIYVLKKYKNRWWRHFKI